jgi:hypothetical protein
MKKRILVLLSVVALMMVMLATSVAPAFAAWDPETGCRGNDRLTREFESPGVDGTRTDDGWICEHDRVKRGGPFPTLVRSFSDNRVEQEPPIV